MWFATCCTPCTQFSDSKASVLARACSNWPFFNLAPSSVRTTHLANSAQARSKNQETCPHSRDTHLMHAGADTCISGCAKTGQQCAGNGIGGVKTCCSSADRCVMKHSGYSECREKGDKPKGWSNKTASCQRESTIQPM
jgi:hypothetical protein